MTAGSFTAADYSNRGLTYKALQCYEEALADYGQAITLDPNNVRTYINRGTVYVAAQRHEQALADYSSPPSLNRPVTSS